MTELTRETVRKIVVDTMNELEYEYGVRELESYGEPTVEEITDKIWAAAS